MRVCLFFVNAISIKSLLNSSFFWGGMGQGGEEGKASGDFPAAAPRQGRSRSSGIAGARVPASQTDPINKEFGERSISACLCALNERQRLQRHAY